MYDAIVVGARCAGSPTAMLLARKGYRVLLVDKATFPSDVMSTHYIHQAGVARLEGWGILDRLRVTNCPPCPSITLDVGPFALQGFPPPLGEIDVGFCPRRTVLDKILVDAAVEAGAELREGFRVDEVVLDSERVTGIRRRDRTGAVSEERARIVIGADGLHSVVARAVRPAEYDATPALACAYYTYWSNVPVDGVELYVRDGRFLGGFATNDALSCVFVNWPASDFQTFRADIERNYLATLELAPTLAERVRGGRREERFVGTVETRNFFRKPYGPGWALVGDAGYHKDPCTGQGITDAFRDAELLADAIDAGFAGRAPLEQMLAAYQAQRDETAKPIYDLTCQRATLQPPPPEIQQLFAALRGNRPEINRMVGVEAGTVPAREFYAPENIRRLIGSA